LPIDHNNVKNNSYIWLLTILISVSLFANSAIVEASGGIYSISSHPNDGLNGNPALISFSDDHSISGQFTRYWWGLGNDAIFSSQINYCTPFNKKWGSSGIEIEYFSSGLNSRFSINLAYSYKFELAEQLGLSCGISGLWTRNQIDLSRTYRMETDPIFEEYGNHADGFGLNLGLDLSYKKWQFGFAGVNLIEPNIAISSNVDDGTIPRKFAVGIGYEVFDWLITRTQGTIDELAGLQTQVSAEFKPFGDLLGIRIGYKENNYTFGLGFYGISSIPMGIDYAVNYPDNSLSKAGISTHTFGFNTYIPKSVKKEPEKPEIPQEPQMKGFDLKVEALSGAPDTLFSKVDSTHIIAARVINGCDFAVDSVYVSTIQISSDTIKAMNNPILIGHLDCCSDTILEWEWKALEIGEYVIVITADDNASNYPLASGKYNELDETNNRLKIPSRVSGNIVATIEVENHVLEIEELNYIAEEEPLVPIIFFDKGKTEISDRFLPTLKTLALRLNHNPDIKIRLRGFIDLTTDPENWEELEIPDYRSIAVKNKLIELGAPENSVIVISTDEYDPALQRIGEDRKATYESSKDKLWAEQENRRVEIEAWITGYSGPVVKQILSSQQMVIPPDIIDSLSMFACEANPLIRDNPEISLILEGYTDNEKKYNEMFELLNNLRTYILEEIECPINPDNFPLIVNPELKEDPEVELHISGEALIYNPRKSALAIRDYTIPPGESENKILVKIEEGDLRRHSLEIIDSRGYPVRTLSSGRGDPDSEIIWDWFDKNGNLIDPRETYRVKLTAEDITGDKAEFFSCEINLQVTSVEKRKEKSIIVQFAFDEIKSTSLFLESRLEQFADRIKTDAEDPNTELIVKIIGHTDQIGSDRRNMVLSEHRALKEETNIRRYLGYLINTKSDSELDKWMKQNDVVIVREGLADREPYEIERYKNGKFEKTLIGNNIFPEGRAVNRRVIISIEEIREY